MSALPPKADICSALARVRFWANSRLNAAQQKKKPLFDHFVGAGEQRGRYCEIKRLRGLEIDDELKFGGLLNRELVRFSSLENTINISRSLLPQGVIVDPIRNQPAVRHKKAIGVDRRQPELCRKVGDQFV